MRDNIKRLKQDRDNLRLINTIIPQVVDKYMYDYIDEYTMISIENDLRSMLLDRNIEVKLNTHYRIITIQVNNKEITLQW